MHFGLGMPLAITVLQEYLGMFISILILSFLLTRGIIATAHRRKWLQIPNKRSCHEGAVPVGGGVPVVITTLAAWAIWAQPFDPPQFAVLTGAIALAVISWIDDLYSVHPGLRLLLQIAAVSLSLYFIPSDQSVFFQAWPLWLDRLVTGFFWLWFINLFNFMDGIDGLAASETISITIGIILIGSFVGMSMELLLMAVLLAGATIGFLPWNWHKSKIMLGDLGAIPIGFLIGFLLIKLAINGQIIAAFILPLYFITDASFTLARRMLGESQFWRPHREHFYQRAVLAGNAHSDIVLIIVCANIIFVAAAYLSMSQPLLAVLIAGLTVLALIANLIYLEKKLH